MKKTLLLMLFFAGFTLASTYAQRDRSENQLGNSFKERVWFGGNFTLGLGGDSRFEYSSFGIGLSPMIGYKIIKEVSVGPRFGFSYNFIKALDQNLNRRSVNLWNYHLGIFSRIKPFRNFFAHLEFEYENRELYSSVNSSGSQFFYDSDAGEVPTAREFRENFYIGVGYTEGFPIAYEILLLYNVNVPENDPRLPIDLRFGLTYNF